MKKRNEKTSKRVSKTSSDILRGYKTALDDINKIRTHLDYLENFVTAAASSAASALTQAKDKK